MRKLYFLLYVFTLTSTVITAQVTEPDFIGEVLLLNEDSSLTQLDKEIGDLVSGISWATNSWDALTLEVNGGKSQLRLKLKSLQLIVRAVDNNSDPLSIISIYKFKTKKRKRTVLLSENNSGTLLKSKTHSENIIRFSGKRYGNSSYIINLEDLETGEYGVLVLNPNSNDQKRIVISCFSIN